MTAPPAPTRRGLLAGGLIAGAAAPLLAKPAPAQTTPRDPTLIVPFRGVHQAGILTPQPYSGLVAAFDVIDETPGALERLFRLLTQRVAFLTQGGRSPALDPGFPPSGSGILGPEIRPERLTITLALGASLFDDRFGLEALRPPELSEMPRFPNDALDADLCHGDLLLQICAETPEETLHALRDVIKQTPDALALRWKQEGFAATHGARSGPLGTGRNLLGFKDGTANPPVAEAGVADRLVWTKAGNGAPDWCAGGTYMVVRLIRNFVERWDRTPLGEQERIIGRRRDDGAPIGKAREFDNPGYADDPKGARIPLDSHIRLANPDGRPGAQAPMVRRAYNYSNGVTKSGQLDMGLLFIAFQASLEQGFAAVQRRLDGEPLEEYIKPVGGGYFFAVPGIPGADDFLGGALLAAAGVSSKKG